jgi:protein TonB
MRKIYNDIPDFDDLIFENRNREYGAYQLRKRYNRVMLAGILISTLIGCSVVLIPFILKPDNEKVLSGGSRFVTAQMDFLKPPDEEIYIPPAPPPPETSKIQEILRYIAPEVVDTVVTLENTTAATDEMLAQPTDINSDTPGSGNGDELFEGEGIGDNEEPFFLVEVMPTFRGGDFNKFRDWIFSRTTYPQAAIDAKIAGTVYLTFIVEKDGSVSNVTILKGVHPLLDEEAIKTISESPKWSPGLQRGQPVRVRFQIPINFKP